MNFKEEKQSNNDIKKDVLGGIRTNERIIKELSTYLNITCSQVKDLVIEYALHKFYVTDDGTTDELAHTLKYKYLEN